MNACPTLMTRVERSRLRPRIGRNREFKPSMIGFDRVSGVLLQDMARRGQQLIDHSRVGGRLIGADFAGTWAVLQGTGEEPASGRQVSLLGDQHVDDLSELVNRPVQIHPSRGHLDIDTPRGSVVKQRRFRRSARHLGDVLLSM
jgi:hypothetical protein